MWRDMSKKSVLLAGALAFGLVLVACDDDDDDHRDGGRLVDSGRVDGGGDGVDGGGGGVDGGGMDGGGTDAGDVMDEAVTFTFPLTTAAEVPTCAAAGGSAMGNATVSVNADNTEVEVMELTWEGLSGPATAAHIHFGLTGAAGPIVLPLGTDPTSPVSATFTEADYPALPPDGAPNTWQDFVAGMRTGVTYINVHTAACPDGEIRGQIG